MPASEYVAAVIADSPRVFYQEQDASGNPVDSSGNALNMTSVSGAPDYQQTGPLNDFAIRTQSTVRLNRTPVVSAVQDNFTMEMWAKIVGTVGSDGRSLLANGVSASTGWGIDVDVDLSFRSEIHDSLLGSKSVNKLTTAGFSLIVVLRRAGTWEYYFNGALDTANAGPAGTPGVPSGSTVIGAGSGLDVVTAYTAIYETALSADRVLAHYQAAQATTLYNTGFLSAIGS